MTTIERPVKVGRLVDQFERLFFQRELMQYQNSRDAGDELVPRRNRIQTLRGGTAH